MFISKDFAHFYTPVKPVKTVYFIQSHDVDLSGLGMKIRPCGTILATAQAVSTLRPDTQGYTQGARRCIID